MTDPTPTGLVAALARAQATMPTIPKSHTNPHFGSKYADIADVLAVVRPALAAHGIAIVQPVEIDDTGHAYLVTRLLHGTEQLESRVPLQIDQKAQDLGSRLTYLRRYTLAALVGVAAEDDDDGHAASNAPPRTRTAPARPAGRTQAARTDHAAPTPPDTAPPTPRASMLTAPQLAELAGFFETLPVPLRVQFKAEFVDLFGAKPADTPESMWPEITTWMQEKAA